MGTAVETRTYERQESVVFCKTNEEFGGLSNMAPGFRLRVNGIDILTSEALYQACRFPHLPDVQRLIIDQKSPMTAKMKSKPYRSQSREDWDVVRVRIMRWALRVKLAWNWTKFRDLLLATGDRPIVEESRKDDFWGAMVRADGVLAGANVLGRLLMELREEVRGASCDSLRRVELPAVRDFLLYGDPIRVIEAADAGASAEDLFTTMAANRRETRAGDRARPPSPVVPTVGSGRMATGARASSEAADGVSAKAYPRRLIEVDLPIKAISAHARREKSIRHGHISTLHIWWARRPLAACRAVILAALWPDPADPLCPERFRTEAANVMKEWRNSRGGRQRDWGDPAQVRAALLDFIAEFANWDNSTNTAYLEAARRLVQVAHESLGGAPGTRPLVVDPFAGGGAIPLEALRVGADAFASDLNPLPVLFNKVVLEYVPRLGRKLADEVRRVGAEIRNKAHDELSPFYPLGRDGTVPIAYLWARQIRCEGPDCGASLPLLRSLWLARKSNRSVFLRLTPDVSSKSLKFEVEEGRKPPNGGEGTVRKGSATCPFCAYTTPNARVRAQLSARRGGADDARLVAVVCTRPGEQGRVYRAPTKADEDAVAAARSELERKVRASQADGSPLSLVPDEPIPAARPSPNARGLSAVTRMGVKTFGDLFSSRQALALVTLGERAREAAQRVGEDSLLSEAVAVCLALAVSRQVDASNSCCRWHVTGEKHTGAFGRQTLAIVWDFSEVNVLSEMTGGFAGAIEWVAKVCEREASASLTPGHVERASATQHPLPDDAAHAVITDPPYYDAVPYADLSDFFYVWLRRNLRGYAGDLLDAPMTPKEEEAIWNPGRVYAATGRPKDTAFYEQQMARALAEARRVTSPNGIATVVFAHKSTAGWEAILSALVGAGWIATASWPIDTEMGSRVNARGTASLASSVHIVCRPRENPDGSVKTDAIGDWRAVLRELPVRIHEWMPRLAKEGVVGADAIFACLGPALEIFSRYSRVEKASGERVELREYLEQVWAAVAREALSMIFEDADATGLEEDARLTAMWLWTLSTSANGSGNGGAGSAADDEEGADSEDDEEEGTDKAKPSAGFSLEFDAARKIAQGLGAHLEDLGRVIEIKGDKARLLSVAERTRHLFGKDQAQRAPARRAKKVQQLTLFEELDAAEKDAGWGDVGLPPTGETTLDRVHQAMVLFAAGRGDALKRFLVEEGVGRAATFWKLAQSLSALYPNGTDEKRWVDGVLARKKGLGFG